MYDRVVDADRSPRRPDQRYIGRGDCRDAAAAPTGGKMRLDYCTALKYSLHLMSNSSILSCNNGGISQWPRAKIHWTLSKSIHHSPDVHLMVHLPGVEGKRLFASAASPPFDATKILGFTSSRVVMTRTCRRCWRAREIAWCDYAETTTTRTRVGSMVALGRFSARGNRHPTMASRLLSPEGRNG